MIFRDVKLIPGLYFVATPIGNARDITLRALDILASADILAAEDTRTARKLLDIHGVPLAGRSVVAHHDHSGAGVVARLVEAIEAGQSVAYVSEAGTPLISDPGYELGSAVRAAGHSVIAAPGASAVLTALAASGLPTDRFAFLGFLPSSAGARDSALTEVRGLDATLVLYESPNRIDSLLGALLKIFGPDRRMVLARELTKKFEEIRSGTVAELCDAVDDLTLKGEFVVLIAKPDAQDFVSEIAIDDALRSALETMRVKDAAQAVAGALSLPRRDVYQRAIALAKDAHDRGGKKT